MMKLVIGIILALAIGSEALYPLPEPVIPSVVYGVPEESKPVIAPIKTEFSYTIPSLPTPSVEVVAPATVPEIQTPSLVTIDGANPILSSYAYSIPHVPLSILPQAPGVFIDHAATYPAPIPEVLPSLPAVPAPVYGLPQQSVQPISYSYGYTTIHDVPRPQLVYGSPAPYLPGGFNLPLIPSVPAPEVAVSKPILIAESPAVVQEVPQEPAVIQYNYQYQIPHVVLDKVVVPEIPAPVIPHTVYGLPQ